MLTNSILEFFLKVLAIIILPIQFVTTFLLGLLVNITFGLLLIPISIVWLALFLGPLLGLSFLYEKVPFLRILISIVGIPLAIIADIFCALMPSMGESESRVSKLLLCQCFPFTWHCFHLSNQNKDIILSKGYPHLLQVFDRVPNEDKLTWEYVTRMKAAYDFPKQF